MVYWLHWRMSNYCPASHTPEQLGCHPLPFLHKHVRPRWVFTTTTTVGYGDSAPTTSLGQCLGYLSMIFVLCINLSHWSVWLKENHWTALCEVCAFSTSASFFSPCQLATRTHRAAFGIVVQELNINVSKLQCEFSMSSFFPEGVQNISTHNEWFMGAMSIMSITFKC